MIITDIRNRFAKHSVAKLVDAKVSDAEMHFVLHIDV
jgi:hypothetical protein